MPAYREEKGFKSITPNETRLRNLTYSMPVYIDVIKLSPYGKEIDSVRGTLFGEIPVMVRSYYCALWGKSDYQRIQMGECDVDLGGYFIVNGNERAVIIQEKMAINQIFVMKDTKGNFRSEIRSTPNQKLKIPSQIIISYMKPTGKHKGGSKVFRVVMARLTESVPFFILLLAIYPKFQLDWICGHEEKAQAGDIILASLRDCPNEGSIPTYEQAKKYITSKLRNIDLEFFFDSDVLPHIEKSPRKKAMYLCYMLRKLIRVIMGEKNPDDRDHLSNKRMETTGMLLGGLFRQLFLKLVQDIKNTIKKRNDHQFMMSEILNTSSNIITKGLKYSLSTGNWSAGAKDCLRTGVAQLISRQSFVALLSHLRRISSPIGRDGKLVKPRQLHNSYWGYICCNETPEGSACLSLEETVLMGDGSRKKIKDVVVGDEVITFDPNTCKTSSTKVIHQFVKENDKRVFKLTTVSGKEIIATEDHCFMTSEGWKTVGEMDKTTKIGMLVEPKRYKYELDWFNEDNLQKQEVETILQDNGIIVDVAKIITSYEVENVVCILSENSFRGIKEEYKDELRSLGFIPLKNDNEKIPILMKIMGYIASGTCIYRHCVSEEFISDSSS